MSLKIKLEDREKYLNYFRKKEEQYLSAFIIVAMLLVLNVVSIINAIAMNKHVITILSVIMLFIILVNIVAYWCRYKDAKLVANGGGLEKNTVINFNKVRGNELNGIYCKMYIDDSKKYDSLKANTKYEIVYLEGTMGKYVIDIKQK